MRLSCVLGLLLGVGILFFPSSALASDAHVFSSSFGSAGSGDDQVQLAEHSGLAVNEASGDVYVADTANHRVVQFSAAGAFIRAFGADVGGSGIDVCASGCVAGTSASTPGAFEAPTFVAIDNSGGASVGDVYVADTANNLVSKFEANGTLVSTWGAGGQLDGSTAPEGPFGEIAGIAVDSAGTLDILEVEPHLLFKFDDAGTFTSEITTPRGSQRFGLAVDPAGDFFKVNAAPSVEKFESSGADIGQVTAAETATGLGVDASNGELYVDNGGSIDNYAFELSGEVVGTGCSPAEFSGCSPTASFGSGDLSAGAGVAVDGASHTVYAADFGAGEILVFELVTLPDAVTEAASEVTSESATLNGAVNPDELPLTECFFEWGETESYGETAPCEEPDAVGVGEGNTPVPVHAEVAGLNAGATYHFRLVATNANGSSNDSEASRGEDETLQTLGPAIKNESASQITATGARIGGEINPNGEEASFLVQYVTEAQFTQSGYAEATSVPAIPREVGEGTVFVGVIQQLSGLVPQTTYHFRLLATSPAATVQGADMQFSTFALPGAGLPDERAYEMVSPPQKLGEVIPPEPASNLGGSCSECLPGQAKPTMPMQAAPDGKSVLYEGQPFSAGLAAGPNEYVADRGGGEWGTHSLSSPITTGEYMAFSADLSRGVLSQVEPALSPQAPTREGKVFANLYLRDGSGAFQPLVTAEPPHRDPGFPAQFLVRFSGANAGAASTPAFSHLLLEANDALTAEVPGIAPEAPEVEAGEECAFAGADCNLYEWSGGQLRLVNVLPGNAGAASDAVIGSGRLLVKTPQYEAPNVDHAISDDGRRIFWSSEESGQVYARIDGAETLEIPGSGSFLTASADGSQVLLSNGQLFELNEEAEPQAYEESADLSEGEGGFTGILGASEDLSRIYFIDTAALTAEGEENANGEAAEAGALNLYAWDEGETAFIGALLGADNTLGQQSRYGTWKASRPDRTAQVSADGRHLAFMSRAPLTGYDNALSGGGECTVGGGPLCKEVFTYAAEPETLTCASCNPSGQRPIGPSNLSLLRPGTPPDSGYAPFPQPGNLAAEGSGRLFFESQDALSPRDTNGSVQDVYEWEPDEVGSCEKAGGCVFLISSGHSPNDSMFLDSTPSGADAFFITREQLLTRDKDQQLDLYDARIGGGPEESATAPCGGEACKGPIATPPPSPSAGSQEFSGPGNPPAPKPACKPGFTRKGGKCVKKHHKKHHNQAAKRNRGGSFSRRK